MDEQKYNKKNKMELSYNNVNSNTKCVHDYIKDFGITRCSKCCFKYISYLMSLKIVDNKNL